MKIAEIVFNISIESEIKNSLGKKEVFGKGDVSRVYQMISEAMRDMYPEAQPKEEKSRQCTRLGRGLEMERERKGEYGVNIQDAAKIAHEKGLAIRRNTSDRDQIDCVIIPTNTCSCCLIDCDYYGKYPARVERRWNPYLEDLLADDWEVVDD